MTNRAPVSSFYGELTFNKKVMADKLSRPSYEKLIQTIEGGKPLDLSIAGEVAHAMKEWAMEKGATHFTHWFQPQRGTTAEKHDSFITFGKNGEIIESFSAGQLVQSEPDASSFPSGGRRSTFEARGYTAWDPNSPAFIYEVEDTATLVIPSVYLSWTGEVLDIKTPLLRSLNALEAAGIELQKILGNNTVTKITSFGGPEQEYFLIDHDLYESRPDLLVCGRTLFGAAPARGQQLEDQYFDQIKPQILAFMEDFDTTLYRRGIPAKTRHNEVAPNQFEIAPIYETLNLSADHNLQLMAIMGQVAEEHGLKLLIHEKPFAGVNGSGKHVNWSLGDNNGVNYLNPSDKPAENTIFICTLAAVLLGVKEHAALLRTTVAHAGNDHRLGANEAPPAIMSVYLGDYLSAIVDGLAGSAKVTSEVLSKLDLGIRQIPVIARDTSDRNRTSPIAFTGNKFEFRAVGSSQNISEPGTALNLLAAYGYRELTKRLKAAKGNDAGISREKVMEVVKQVFIDTKHVRFEGNNYSAEWHAEAEKRGLPNAKNTPAALKTWVTKPVVDLFTSFGVLSEGELHAKYEIKLEEYCKLLDIEFRCGLDIAQTLILPAIGRAMAELSKTIDDLGDAGVKSQGLTKQLSKVSACYDAVFAGIETLAATIEESESFGSAHERAQFCAQKGNGTLAKLREAVDSAEKIVPDDLWPLAKYQELLYTLG